jgi:quinol-cytochrome oxidoreductase complex cytochrome b subunit
MAKRIREEEIFPRNPNKTYGLMELVKGSSPRVDRGPDDMVSSWPHLLIREAVLFAFTFILILALALFDPPPLEKPADPTKPPNPAKAPWYFLGLQEMVSYDAFWGGIGLPGILILVLMAIPYLDRHHSGIGRWFARSRSTACFLFTVLFVIPTIVLIIIGVYFRGPNWGFYFPWSMPVEPQILLPHLLGSPLMR